MIAILARFAGIRPDRIHRATGLLLDEFGLFTSMGIVVVMTLAGIAGCALGYMAP